LGPSTMSSLRPIKKSSRCHTKATHGDSGFSTTICNV
jgi:hypothetical protein